MASNWVRQPSTAPKKRKLILSYDTADQGNAVVEALVDRIPYGQLNRLMMDALRRGAPAILAGLSEGPVQAPASRAAQNSALVQAVPTQGNASVPVVADAPPTHIEARPVPPSHNDGRGFGRAATSMFGMGEKP